MDILPEEQEHNLLHHGNVKELLTYLNEGDKCLVFGYIRNAFISYSKPVMQAIKMLPTPIVELIIVFFGYIAIDSVILTQNEQRMILKILRQQPLSAPVPSSVSAHNIAVTDVSGVSGVSGVSSAVKELNLLYRMSRDGKSGAAWHSRCNHRGATILVVHSEFNHVFGGYTSVPWTSDSKQVADPYAFLFLLRSQFVGHDDGDDDGDGDTQDTDTDIATESHPNIQKVSCVCPKVARLRLHSKTPACAVYHYKQNGPAFGGGHALIVDPDLQSNTYMRTPGAYKVNGNEFCGGPEFMTGRHRQSFKALDWEIHQVVTHESPL